MTQKSATKPNSAAAGKVVVFGLDSNWRPHAAWFPHTQADQARAAAKQLRLNVIDVPNGTCRRSRRQTPGWPNPCGRSSDGPAHPGRPVRESRRHHQSTRRSRTGTGRANRDRLPRALGRHQAGPPRPRPRQPDRRLVRSDCRWSDGRQGHPPVPRLTLAIQSSPCR